jgi:hypothetical protein
VLVCQRFLTKAETLWSDIEVTLRSGRAARRIKENDEYLKKRGDYDIITATLDENTADNAEDEGAFYDDGDTEI